MESPPIATLLAVACEGGYVHSIELSHKALQGMQTVLTCRQLHYILIQIQCDLNSESCSTRKCAGVGLSASNTDKTLPSVTITTQTQAIWQLHGEQHCYLSS